MKKLFSFLSTLSIGLLILLASCSKFSPDTPFPDEYKPSLYIASDNRVLYSYDVATLEKNWEYHATSPVKGTPIVNNDHVIISGTNGVTILNKLTGLLHKEINNIVPTVATPLLKENKLYICTSSKIYCLNATSYEVEWSSAGHGLVKGSPTVQKIDETDKVGLICANTNGEVFALNVENGATIWKKQVSTSSFLSAPHATSKSIFIGNTNNKIYRLKTLDGNSVWEYTTEGPISASPITKGGNIMIGSSDRHFYSIDSLNGTIRWKVPTNDRIESSAFYDNQFIYVGSNDNHLYCIDIINGLLTWKKDLGKTLRSSPIVFNNKVYMGSDVKQLYVLDAANGAILQQIDIKGQIITSPVIDNITSVIYPSVTGNYFDKNQ